MESETLDDKMSTPILANQDDNEDINAQDGDNPSEDNSIGKTPNSEAKEELAGGTCNNDPSYSLSTTPPKEPLFKLEPRKPGCVRNDKMLMLSKKVGFFGLVTFLLLSIVFGMAMKYWKNFLNLLFMGLAIASYGIQCVLHLVSISKCNCIECSTEKKKLGLIISVCALGTLLFVVLTVLRALEYI